MERVNNLFVRINYEEEKSLKNTEFKKAEVNYDKKVTTNKYIIAGGFYNKSTSSFIFKAKNFDEANNIAHNIFIKNNSVDKNKVKCNFFLVPDVIKR